MLSALASTCIALAAVAAGPASVPELPADVAAARAVCAEARGNISSYELDACRMALGWLALARESGWRAVLSRHTNRLRYDGSRPSLRSWAEWLAIHVAGCSAGDRGHCHEVETSLREAGLEHVLHYAPSDPGGTPLLPAPTATHAPVTAWRAACYHSRDAAACVRVALHFALSGAPSWANILVERAGSLDASRREELTAVLKGASMLANDCFGALPGNCARLESLLRRWRLGGHADAVRLEACRSRSYLCRRPRSEVVVTRQHRQQRAALDTACRGGFSTACETLRQLDLDLGIAPLDPAGQASAAPGTGTSPSPRTPGKTPAP